MASLCTPSRRCSGNLLRLRRRIVPGSAVDTGGADGVNLVVVLAVLELVAALPTCAERRDRGVLCGLQVEGRSVMTASMAA